MEDIDLTLFDDPVMTCPDAPFLEPSVLIPPFHDVNLINNQINQLSIDVNTQDLRSRPEKVKSQWLSATIKNLRQEITLLNESVAQT